jgi:hypothetical protein
VFLFCCYWADAPVLSDRQIFSSVNFFAVSTISDMVDSVDESELLIGHTRAHVQSREKATR